MICWTTTLHYSPFSLDVVSIKKAVLPGTERFPLNIEVHFNYYGEDVTLNLLRDDDLTSMLSESLFVTSKFLPSDVFEDDKAEVWFFFSIKFLY